MPRKNKRKKHLQFSPKSSLVAFAVYGWLSSAVISKRGSKFFMYSLRQRLFHVDKQNRLPAEKQPSDISSVYAVMIPL